MKNFKSTKRALLTSVLSMVLCFTMLLGTTFAWFTDSVTSKNNIITAGNLDIELYYQVEGQTDWTKVTDKTNIFKDGALWEPGHTEVVKLKVVNEGTLALKYQLGVNVAGETESVNVAGKAFKLSDYIKYGIVDGAQTYTRDQAIAAVDATATKLNAAYSSGTLTLAAKNDTDSDEKIVTMVVYMPKSVGNEANAKLGAATPTINLGINLFATQANAESDSFGSDYDDDAWHPDMEVATGADLQAALNNGVTNIALAADIELTESLVIPAAATTYSMRSTPVVIDLNGKNITIQVAYDDNNSTASSAIVNYGNVVLQGNGTIQATNNYTVRNYGNMVIDGVTVENGIMNFADLTVESGNISNARSGKHAIYGNGAKLTINGGKFHNGNAGNATIFSYAGEVVINGGEFTIADGTATLGWTSCLLDAQGGAKFTINGGVVNGEIRDYQKNTLVYGGTFTHKSVNNFLAEGFKAEQVGNAWVVVSKSVDKVVATPDALKDVLNAAAAAGAGDTTIMLAGDIDMTGSAWTSINVDGYNGAGVVTIDGNGHSISGLTAPLFAGGFAGKSGIVIKNLTIKDSNIVSTSGLGGGAFIDTADSMHVITLENCHLINSTVSGERTGGLIGWCSGYAKLNDGPVKANVTISGCSVVDSTIIGAGSAGAIAGHPGASDYTYTTIENCVVKNVEVISNETGSWRTGAIVGTANNGHIVINNVTVEGVTLTQNGVVAESTHLFGRFVPAGTGTLVIDGAYVVNNAAELKAAVAKGETNLYLVDGEYNIDGCGGKTLTLNGSKNVVLKVMNEGEDGADYGFDGSTVTFNGVTVDTTANTGSYKGFARMKATFNDCTFIGGGFTTFSSTSFNNCTFDLAGYIWTWGANEVNFTECTFIGDSRTILAHGGASTVITIKDCDFAATSKGHTGSGDWTAAVEIDPTGTNTYTINFVGENSLNENYSGWTRIKDGSTGHTVTGLE